MKGFAVFAAVVLLATSAIADQEYDESQWTYHTRPYIVGHRGTPAYFPEHTAASYLLAIDAGADFIECDVVWTKDLVPVCRHDAYLSSTTDVMDTPLKSKETTYNIDGRDIKDVFVHDLTLAELRTLRCKQAYDFRPQEFDGMFQIITLEEHIQIALDAKRTVGIYPELKNPTFFNKMLDLKGKRVGDLLLAVLTAYGYGGNYNSPQWRKQPIFIQCFEQDELVYISPKTCMPLVQLLNGPGSTTADRNKTFEEMVSDESLDEIATYSSGAGPSKSTCAEVGSDGKIKSTGLVERLQNRGMQVHHYTLRPEARFIFPTLKNETMYPELDLWYKDIGVDGAFTDAATIVSGYFSAEKIAGYAWSLNGRMRWNAEPAKCKRADPKKKN